MFEERIARFRNGISTIDKNEDGAVVMGRWPFIAGAVMVAGAFFQSKSTELAVKVDSSRPTGEKKEGLTPKPADMSASIGGAVVKEGVATVVVEASLADKSVDGGEGAGQLSQVVQDGEEVVRSVDRVVVQETEVVMTPYDRTLAVLRAGKKGNLKMPEIDLTREEHWPATHRSRKKQEELFERLQEVLPGGIRFIILLSSIGLSEYSSMGINKEGEVVLILPRKNGFGDRMEFWVDAAGARMVEVEEGKMAQTWDASQDWVPEKQGVRIIPAVGPGAVAEDGDIEAMVNLLSEQGERNQEMVDKSLDVVMKVVKEGHVTQRFGDIVDLVRTLGSYAAIVAGFGIAVFGRKSDETVKRPRGSSVEPPVTPGLPYH